MGRWIGLVLVGLALAAAGCGGGDGEADASEESAITAGSLSEAEDQGVDELVEEIRTTVTGDGSATVSVEDLALASDIAEGLAAIARTSELVDSCGGGVECVTAGAEALGNMAERRVNGLRDRVDSAELACLRDGGSYYVFALDRYVLARDFISQRSDFESATRNAEAAARNLTQAEEAFEGCPAEVTG